MIGFPRSRTAWLSVVLTHGDCFAEHDLCVAGSRLIPATEYAALMNRHRFTCDCSSAILMRLALLQEVDYPIILVERDPDQSRDSWLNYLSQIPNNETAKTVLNDPDLCWGMITDAWLELQEVFADRIVHRVGFDQLADCNEVLKLCDIVAPGQYYDPYRILRMQDLNIQESWHSRSQ